MKTIEQIALTIYQPIGMTSNEFAYTLAKEYAKEAIKADRENLLNHLEYFEVDGGSSVEPNSIINAPNIELL